jgi:RimJ/RimL family protein N-acetyltransferase
MRIILETERLLLRELVEEDARDVYAINSNPNVMRYMGGEAILLSPEEALAVLRTRILPLYARYGMDRWAVVLRDSTSLIGLCGLRYLPKTNEYDLGYRLLESHWGKGYATECARAVLEYGLLKLPGARIVGRAYLENVASIRVLEKIGMQFEGNQPYEAGTVAVYVSGSRSSSC